MRHRTWKGVKSLVLSFSQILIRIVIRIEWRIRKSPTTWSLTFCFILINLFGNLIQMMFIFCERIVNNFHNLSDPRYNFCGVKLIFLSVTINYLEKIHSWPKAFLYISLPKFHNPLAFYFKFGCYISPGQ